jgi:hypothetical protein
LILARFELKTIIRMHAYFQLASYMSNMPLAFLNLIDLA